jgi:hypothetical protein
MENILSHENITKQASTLITWAEILCRSHFFKIVSDNSFQIHDNYQKLY